MRTSAARGILRTMELNPIAVAIPAFFILIAVEVGVSWAKGRAVYRLHDAVTDLSCGISSQVSVAFLKGLTLVAYVAVYDHLRLTELPGGSAWTWVLAIVAYDLLYYAWHRASHRVNVLWAAHVVHHQSQDYNLAVALRQAVLTSVTSVPFYLPLAILGVPPWVYALTGAINTLYQFWIHTRLVGRLGPLEWVLNTPSHHRLHHGINPSCIDRNHAGMFIVWDRLFGTFAAEPPGEPVYGTVKPHRSWNPLWANVASWVDLWRLSASCTRWQDRIWAWLAPPEWRPAEQGGPVAIPDIDRSAAPLWDSTPYPGSAAYVLAWFLPIAVAVTAFIQLEGALALPDKVAVGGLIVATVLAWGALFEGRAWGLWLEKARLVAVALAAGALAAEGALPQWALAPVAVALVASAVWVGRMGRSPRPVAARVGERSSAG